MPETIVPRTISVPFEGEGSGIGELTWGQRELLRAMRIAGRTMVVGGVAPLTQTSSVDDILVRVQYLMRRHQTLRTLFTPDAQGGWKQVLHSAGELVVELYDLAPDDDIKSLAQAVSDRYSELGFDIEHDWPLRIALFIQHGTVEYAVFIYNHLSVDGMGLGVLLNDLAAMDPVTLDGPALTAFQPLELAERQSAAAARRQNQTALRHWESVARGVPEHTSAAADLQDPPYRELWFRSPAGLPAMQAVAARCGTDTGPVVFAASAVALGRVTGLSAVAFLSIVNNRFRPGLADAVMQLAQRSPCLLELEGQTLEQVVGQAQRASLRAGMYGYLDPDECDRMLEQVALERGARIDLNCYYNDRRAPVLGESDRPAPAGDVKSLISSLLPQTTLRWGGQLSSQDNKFFLHINDSPDALDFLICADTAFLGPAGLERCAREFEAVLVEAASGTSTSVSAAAEVTAEPPEHTSRVPDPSR